MCDSDGQLLYSLYGVVVHSGGMHDGHYIAYTRTRAHPHPRDARDTPTGSGQETTTGGCDSEEQAVDMETEAGPADDGERCFELTSTEGQWYYASDTHIRTATEAEVMKSQAYLLFYERLPLKHQK